MKIKAIQVDMDSLLRSIAELNAVYPLGSFPDAFLKLFRGFLLSKPECCLTEFTPCAVSGSAGSASDSAFICRIVWNTDLVTAAFLACKSKFHDSLSLSPSTSAILPAVSSSLGIS